MTLTPKTSSAQFTSLNRAQQLQHISQEKFDLLIIGGGITGAGIALDAAIRGLKVLVLEKKDFAWGTSSRSTKLIHGGLRYLKQLEIKLVHEVGTERAIVHHNARHIVRPERMLLPIIQGGSLGKNLSSLGLWIYDRLAGVPANERRKMLTKEETIAEEPLLREEILKGGGLYYEYRTDDARLTIEVLKTAIENGAQALSYAEVTGFRYNKSGQIEGVDFKDQLSNTECVATTSLVVNAAGPWVDSIRTFDQEGVIGKRLHLTKGVHIVVPRALLPLQQSTYFDVEVDNRMVFAIPRFGVTYLGTTDTNFSDSINSPSTKIEDVEYILAAANYMFPSVKITPDQVESSWAGLRPLIHQDGKSPSELSRKDEIFLSKTGLISIAGGKLTGYRKMAEKVVDFACKQLELTQKCLTRHLQLSGGYFKSDAELERFIQLRIGESKQIGATADDILQLAYRYGSNIDLIIEKAFELAPTISDPTQRLLAAEIWYACKFEYICTLSDFLIRRSGRLYFERPKLEQQLSFIVAELSQQLAWTPETIAQNLAEFEAEYQLVLGFKD